MNYNNSVQTLLGLQLGKSEMEVEKAQQSVKKVQEAAKQVRSITAGKNNKALIKALGGGKTGVDRTSQVINFKSPSFVSMLDTPGQKPTSYLPPFLQELSRQPTAGKSYKGDTSNLDAITFGAKGSPTGYARKDFGSAFESESKIFNAVTQLGDASGKYVWGATGPDAFDCSGLIWNALGKTGVYKGPRFTTHNFNQVAPQFAEPVSTPAKGDIVVWPGHHIGVVADQDKYYSARSPAKGIGDASLSADSGYFGMKPQYWRVKGGF